MRFVTERGQPRPADPRPAHPGDDVTRREGKRHLDVVRRQWVRVAAVGDVPRDGAVAIRHGAAQMALFHFAARGEWYATQNLCPHKQQMVLARGILGDKAGTPKVACPMHKKTFDLQTGACLSGDSLEIETYPVRVDGDDVWVELPPLEEMASEAERALPTNACSQVLAEAASV